MRKLRTNDLVKVIAGKDKGKTGKILRVVNKGYELRVVVEGLNLVKKHVKRNPNINESGGIKSMEASIHISNVAIFNSSSNKHDKVKFKMNDEGVKQRIYASTNEVIS